MDLENTKQMLLNAKIAFTETVYHFANSDFVILETTNDIEIQFYSDGTLFSISHND